MSNASNNLRCADVGRGVPVLLIHGFPLSGAMWRPQQEGLRAHARMIIPDLPGFGGSAQLEGEPSLSAYADALVRLLDQHSVAQAVVCGLSMGGYVALDIARRHPDRLAGLVLADTKAGADTAEGRAGRDEMIALVRERGASAVADRMLPKLLAPTSQQLHPGLSMHIREIIVGNGVEGIAYALAAMRDRPDSTEMLGQIAMPTLVIVGAEDSITPPAEAQKLAQAIPGAHLETIAHAGHLSNLEQPEFFNLALRNFLERIPAAAI